MLSQIVSLISVILALIAICVSAWQARFNMSHARYSRSFPVITEIFKEFGSLEFRESVRNLLSLPPSTPIDGGFSTLLDSKQEDAYKVCYFFDYIGTLVAFGIVREDIVIATMGTRIVQVWTTLLPAIISERAYRSKTYASNTPPGFLVYYEHLVASIDAAGGREAAFRIQAQLGLRQLPALADADRAIETPPSL